jgi:Tol biopolymer transport system component
VTKSQTLFISSLVLAPMAATAEVSTPKQIADRPSAHCQAPRWAPDGSQIAYEVYDPSKDTRETWILRLTADGRRDGDATEVSAGRAQAADLLGGRKPPVVEFEWAPNMKLLSRPVRVLEPRRQQELRPLRRRRLAHEEPGQRRQPSWSKDGRYIAYASQQKDSGDIYAIDLQGDSNPIRLTFWPTATEFHPKFAPTGRTLMFTRAQSGSKGQDIGVIQDTGKPQETLRMVTEWPGDEIRPSWSPDGKLIAFYANKDTRVDKVFDLWVVDATGQNAKKLASNVVVDESGGPAWAPDSSSVFFVQQDFKADNPVKWVRADGSAHGTIDTGTQLNGDVSAFGKGDRILLAFKALGQKGSTDKTWERLFLVTLTLADLKADAP